MSIIVKDSRTDVVIIFKARYAMSVHFFLTVLIESVDLSSRRDLIFESEQMNTLTLFVSVVDNSLSS